MSCEVVGSPVFGVEVILSLGHYEATEEDQGRLKKKNLNIFYLEYSTEVQNFWSPSLAGEGEETHTAKLQPR